MKVIVNIMMKFQTKMFNIIIFIIIINCENEIIIMIVL